jgi:hypothetical protein
VYIPFSIKCEQIAKNFTENSFFRYIKNAAAEELRAKDVKFVVEPMQVRPGLKIAYIEAPDKVRIELSERS